MILLIKDFVFSKEMHQAFGLFKLKMIVLYVRDIPLLQLLMKEVV